jgi:hypothetical protein
MTYSRRAMAPFWGRSIKIYCSLRRSDLSHCFELLDKSRLQNASHESRSLTSFNLKITNLTTSCPSHSSSIQTRRSSAMLSLVTLTTAIYLLSPRTVTYIFRTPLLHLRRTFNDLHDVLREVIESMPKRRSRSTIIHFADCTLIMAINVLLTLVAIAFVTFVVSLNICMRLLLCWTIVPLKPTLSKWRKTQQDLGRETRMKEWILNWLDV